MVMLSGLQTSLSGMKVAQNQMDIVGRNLANIDTVGYTRKTAAQKNLVLGGYSAGVQLGDITRTVNEGLLKVIWPPTARPGILMPRTSFWAKRKHCWELRPATIPLPPMSAICNRLLKLSLLTLPHLRGAIIC